MTTAQKALLFLNGTPRGVSNVVRDGAGRLQSWTENGHQCVITRQLVSLLPQALRVTGPARLYTEFTFTGGQLVAISGDEIPTIFMAEIAALGGRAITELGAGVTCDSINALSVPIPWNAASNDRGLASGVNPTPDTMFIVVTAGTTNLDGINKWAIGDCAYFSDVSNTWHRIAAGLQKFSALPGAQVTGSTSESSALVTIPMGPQSPEAFVRFWGRVDGGGTADNTIIRVKVNGVTCVAPVFADNWTECYFEGSIMCFSGSAQRSEARSHEAGSNALVFLGDQANANSVLTNFDLTVTMQNSSISRNVTLKHFVAILAP